MTARYPTKAQRAEATAEPTLPRDRLWTDKDVAHFFGVHPITLVVWRRDGKGPRYFRPDPNDARIVRYDPADCYAYVEKHKRNPTAARPDGVRDERRA